MKRVVISDEKVLDTPYHLIDDMVKNTLKEAGFDLDKPVSKMYDFSTRETIFKQTES